MEFSARRALRAAFKVAGLVGTVAACCPAYAQDTAETGAQSGPFQEIIVTAQRREESLQKSSLSLQVLTSADLARSNLTQSTDLNTIVPGIQIGNGGNSPQIYIRGVGDFAASALSNPAVAVNTDGVYVARPQAINSLFYDLERIEVLKGPQGTLYGRNASGGAINVITKRPSLAGVEGYVTATYGNYNNKQVEAAINTPLGPTLALRVAGQVVDRDGYLSDGTDADNRQAVRARLLWEPSSSTSLLLNADYAHEGGKGPGFVVLPTPAGNGKWSSITTPEAAAQLAATPPIGFLLPAPQPDSFRNNDFWNFSAELNTNLGFATFTLLPAYRYSRLSERNYPAGLRNTIPRATAKQVSVEARLGNSTEHLKWVIGGYFFDEKQKANQQIYQGMFQDNDGFYDPHTTSLAAFGQATFSLTDSFRLIGGLRYTHERIELEGALYTYVPAFPVPPADLPVLLEAFGGKRTFDSVTWRAGAEMDLSPRNMLFVTASTGFKAGGFNQTVAPEGTYDPEKVTAFEFGSRNEFLGGRLRVNLEAFWWKLDDGQIAHVKFDPLGNVNLITDNAGQSEMKGANIEVQAALSDNDLLRFFVEYNDAKYKDFSYDTAFSIFGTQLFNPASTGCAVGSPRPGATFGSEIVKIDCSGRAMPRAPRWSGAATYQHTFNLHDDSKVTFDATMQFASQRWLGYEYVPLQKADAYATFDANLTYSAPGDRWSISAYVRNITEKAVYTGGSVHSFAPPLAYTTIAPPRTFGVRLRYSFGN